MSLSPIHPFPARMAPELVYNALKSVPKCGRVLDPMSGSGTVARAAVEAGLHCVGGDIDPLAVLMTRVWTTPLDTNQFLADSKNLVQDARALPADAVERTDDPETRQFIDYWFASQQEADLARLSTVLRQKDGPMKDAMTIALSRTVITKKQMASLARDTSHSRPHRVADSNSFDVYAGFLRSTRYVAARLKPDLIQGTASIHLEDARILNHVQEGDFDLALTSPPYLNAIDYLRGHRLWLVWQGYEMQSLRKIRAAGVGAERMISETESSEDVSRFVIEKTGSTLGPRHWGWIRRYARDMDAVLRQLKRAVKQNGKIVLVLGDSFLRGAVIENANLVKTLAQQIELQLLDMDTRDIPARRRYLPPPGDGRNALDARMRTESVLTFVVP